MHEGGEQILIGKDGSRIFVDKYGELIPRSGLHEVPEDVLEVLRERNRAAGVEIDASGAWRRGTTYRPDIGGCIGAVLDRTVGSRFYYVPKHGRAEAEVA